ncbi:MAG: ATP-binding cassette domain-containing protein, partial [Defluviitaleaceae bacterium]|nr:ATP-binding cassette domain-containing protein [Defluviitaleaceae bacterium]
MDRDGIVVVEGLCYEYQAFSADDEQGVRTVALAGVDAEVARGEFVAVLGHNGSGKSTFAKHLNVLLQPSDGAVWVKGLCTAEGENIWEIRRSVGMVFQNPDNQIIATIVEEDVAFGPENLGVEPAEIRRRVDESLASVGMGEYADSPPHRLSGGQKQRITIA